LNVKVPFYVPWITEEDKNVVLEALNSRWLTGGPRAREFERLFADYIGVKYAVSVNSGTAALHLALLGLNLKQGDEVVVPVFTFAAVADAVFYCRAKPVFADIDSRTFNMSPQSLAEKATRRTKAVIVVHHGGQPADMKEIMETAEDHGLAVIEDCAHSLGAKYGGMKTGGIGIAGCFSFYATKIITTIEGGMLTTNNAAIARKAELLRGHGMTKGAWNREKRAEWVYDIKDVGYNYRLNEIQAALGTSQLKRINDGIKKRAEAARYYAKKLAEIDGVVTPFKATKRTHVYHLYVVKILEEKCGISRDELFRELSAKGIGLGVHFIPLHFTTFYRKSTGCKSQSFPNAEAAYREVLSLPIYPTISKDQMEYVTESMKDCLVRAKSG
jgi:dTDP-4-amino-4,6-dideoxygalactose transaminase